MADVIADISPSDLLSRFRGQIFSARPGYPDVLLLKARDVDGGEWWFSTFYAKFSPSDPDAFLGKRIVAAEPQPDGGLNVGFSDGSRLDVLPVPLEPGEPGDDLETWHLLSPDGLALDYGPGDRWVLEALEQRPLNLTSPRRGGVRPR